jgi:hypothetical protein
MLIAITQGNTATLFVVRDGWAVFTIVAIAVGAAAACLTAAFLVPIFHRFRSRPELRIEWYVDDAVWHAHQVLAIPHGATAKVTAAFVNIGDAGGEPAYASVAIASAFDLIQRDAGGRVERTGRHGQHEIAGQPPVFRATSLAEERRFYLGMRWGLDFEVRSPQLPEERIPPARDYVLVADFSTDRLNRRGHRVKWLQSFFTVGRARTMIPLRAIPEGSAVGPGLRRTERIVRALPAGHTLPGRAATEAGLVSR